MRNVGAAAAVATIFFVLSHSAHAHAYAEPQWPKSGPDLGFDVGGWNVDASAAASRGASAAYGYQFDESIAVGSMVPRYAVRSLVAGSRPMEKRNSPLLNGC